MCNENFKSYFEFMKSASIWCICGEILNTFHFPISAAKREKYKVKLSFHKKGECLPGDNFGDLVFKRAKGELTL